MRYIILVLLFHNQLTQLCNHSSAVLAEQTPRGELRGPGTAEGGHN